MLDFQSWVDVCKWIKTNTPKNALFLTPRSAQSFKWRTGRAEVVTRKDIPQSAAGIVEWSDRLRTIHDVEIDGERTSARTLGHLGTTRLRELAAKYRFDYIVTERRRAVALPIVYENDVYAVYRTSNQAD
jgi:hypothetical protein